MSAIRIFQSSSLESPEAAILERLPFKTISLERPIQRLCEANLGPLFGLEFLATEFTIQDLRIDTLAFDPTASAYVIVEYKRGASYSVVDQGFAYLNLLRNHREAFLYKHSEVAKRHVEAGEISWSRCRVFFVSQEFTHYQRLAVEYKDYSFELYQIGLHGDSVVTLERVGSSDDAIPTDEPAHQVTQTMGTPSVDEHFEGRPAEIRQVYEMLKARIVTMADDVSERPIQVAILFEVANERFVEIVPQQRQVSVYLDHFPGDDLDIFVDDLDARGAGHLWSVGGYKIVVKPGDNLEPVFELIQRSLNASLRGSPL